MRGVRKRLTFANVTSVIALFVALGGTGLAASQLGKNSVGPKQLRKNAVTTPKIKNRAVTGAKIRANTLGTVPSAANAQTLGGLSADQIVKSSRLRCPAGTEAVSGVCFETAARPSAKWLEALETCAAAGRSLPPEGDLAAYLFAKEGVELNWSGSVSFYNSDYVATYVVKRADGKIEAIVTSIFEK